MWFERMPGWGSAVGAVSAVLSAFLLAGLLATSAWPRMHAGPNMLEAGHRLSGAIAPLDGTGSFATPAGAYSLRRLKSAYTGPGIKLRRTTGGTQDINFLGFTGFTGAPIDTVAAQAFCNATTCFVDTWYDQSGLAQHMPQATTANQPAFIFNCIGNLPCLEITTATQVIATLGAQTPVMPTTYAALGNRVTGTGGCTLAAQAGQAGNDWGPWSVALGNWQLGVAFVLAAAEATWHAGSAIMNGASSVLRVDAAETPGSKTGGTVPGVYIGFQGSASTTCRIAENIRWDGYALSAAERAALQSNQKSYYGTP